MLKEMGLKYFQNALPLLKRFGCGSLYANLTIYPDCFETILSLTRFIKPKYLCDIGASSGNWSYVMHRMNPGLKHVVFFEPQKKMLEKLQSLPLGGVKKVVYGCGLGERETYLQIKGGTSSASFLNASNAQEFYFPGRMRNESEEVEIKVFDKVYAEDNLPSPDVIKLDVQGYELNVLRGGINVLSNARYLVVELSFREFYTGQPFLWELLKFLEENYYTMIAHGYELWSSKKPPELLQVDGIFENTRLKKT